MLYTADTGTADGQLVREPFSDGLTPASVSLAYGYL